MYRIALAVAAFCIVVPAFARDGDEVFVWRGAFYERHQLANLAAEVRTFAEAEEFRDMIRKVRSDVDAVVGGLLIDIAPDRRAEFFRVFSVGDPVYGSPDEMARQSPEMKQLLMVLAPRVSSSELWLLRTRLLDAPPHLVRPLVAHAREMGPFGSIASICQRYACLANCELPLIESAASVSEGEVGITGPGR